MIEQKGRSKYPWIVIVVLAIILILFSVFYIAIPDVVFDVTMERTGSSLTWGDLDERSSVGINFLIVRPFWDEILFGLLGLFCAWGIRKRVSFAWKLGVFWSVMMMVSGVIITLNEIVVSGWDMVCLLPIYSFGVGSIALICLLAAKKEFKETAT